MFSFASSLVVFPEPQRLKLINFPYTFEFQSLSLCVCVWVFLFFQSQFSIEVIQCLFKMKEKLMGEETCRPQIEMGCLLLYCCIQSVNPFIACSKTWTGSWTCIKTLLDYVNVNGHKNTIYIVVVNLSSHCQYLQNVVIRNSNFYYCVFVVWK